MASHNINISVNNNVIGVPASSDGVMMIFVHGYAIPASSTATGIALDTAYLFSSLAQAQAAGLSLAFDEANNVYMWGHVNEFYDGSLNDGALLWFVVTSPNVGFDAYVASTTFTSLVTYTAQENPANRAKMIGFCYTVPTVPNTSANMFRANVPLAIAAIQTAQLSMFANYYPWSAILDGNNMNYSIGALTLGNLPSMVPYNAQSVSLCITGTQPNGVSGVGLALGRFARISVGHGFGAVADGPVTTNTAYLTNGILTGENVISGSGGTVLTGYVYTVLVAPVLYNGITYQPGQTFTGLAGKTTFTTSAGGYIETGSTPVGTISQGPNGGFTILGNDQYMFLCTQFGESGFYWNDAATCIGTQFAESQQEYNRVANNLSAAAINFFTQFKGSALPSIPQTGAINPAWCTNAQNTFNTQYVVPLVNNGDIVGATLVITGPNYNASGNLNFVLTITRSTILGNVTGVVTFSVTV
jgi:hypothetical protein